MANNKKQIARASVCSSVKAVRPERDEQVKERVGKVVKDFYKRHGAAMTVLAYE